MRGKGPALFELMRAGKQPPGIPPPRGNPETVTELKAVQEPQRSPEIAAESPRSQEPTLDSTTAPRAGGQGGWNLDRPLTIPMSAVLLAAGGVLTLIVLVWVVGYRTGWTGGESRAVQDLTGPSTSVQDPLKEPPLNPTLLAAPAGTGIQPPPIRPGDPRQAGLNYLRLAILKQADAERAVDFLGAGGLPAFSIPVDRPGAAPKNPGLYVVYASQGVTRDELKAHVDAVERTNAAAAELGPRWKKEFRSSTDFADRYWDKYVP